MSETIVLNGETYEALRLEVISSVEPWAEYLTADGSVHRIKHVLGKIVLIPALNMHLHSFTPVFDVSPGTPASKGE